MPHQVIEPNRKQKDSSFLEIAQPLRECHNSANEKHYTSNYQFLQSILCLLQPSQLPFPLFKRVLLFLLCEDLHMVHHGCRSVLQFFGDAHAPPPKKNFCWKNNWHTVLGQYPPLEKQVYQFNIQSPGGHTQNFDSVNWVLGPET